VGARLKKMTEEVPKVTVTSNEIEVTVLGPGDK